METINFSCPVCNKNFKTLSALTNHIKYGKHTYCLECGNVLNGNKFCNNSCAASYNNRNRDRTNPDYRKNVSESLKSFYEAHPKSSSLFRNVPCKCCGKIVLKSKTGFCSDCSHKNREITNDLHLKLSRAGRQSASVQANVRRSKNEIYFSDEIHKKFSDSVNNVNMFNGWDADVIIPSLKIAILWNGIWHYKNIKGKLNQIQNRDKIKYHEIIKAGYLPYIITDLGKFSKDKCDFEIKRFLDFLEILKDIPRVREQVYSLGS